MEGVVLVGEVGGVGIIGVLINIIINILFWFIKIIVVYCRGE